MNPSLVSKNDVVKSIVFSLLIIFLIIIFQINDKRTKIVFCNVGQGDAAYIRIKNKVDILIDAGPDKKVLNCLGKYMPFWDRKIELAVLSHHDKDHYGGFSFVVDRYRLYRFITVNYRFDSKSYKQLENKIRKKKIDYKFVFQGEEFSILDDNFRLYWPPNNLKSYDSNDYSLVFMFEENNYKVLFTGDTSPRVLNQIPRLRFASLGMTGVNILKIPHHGSKNGLTNNFLDLADPKIGVISVGKNNSYGHPSQEVLEMLKAKNIIIKRTDRDGDIEFNLKESP